MRKQRNWLKPDERLVRHIQRKAGCLPVTAAVLANRGVVDQPDIECFLSPSLQMIQRGFEMADMERAVTRIAEAVSGRQKILIFGDYDVDGITATTLLHEFLTAAGAEAVYYIPHRLDEGYGLKSFHIKQVAQEMGADLIITVDCGSASMNAVLEANQCGIDVIITDHHGIADPPPPALAVVNPRRCDCRAGTDCLAGVGVAFLLLVCLRKHLREINFWQSRAEPNLKSFCDLVALGTVADIVPLVRENRVLTRAGLDVINTSPRTGIKALIEVSGIKKPFLTAEDIAFRLAPRLNAAGRMDHAHPAVKLLETRDPDQARSIAQSINQLNTSRQTEENRIYRRICFNLEEQPELLERRTLVLSGSNWHEGILGIVASRLARQYWRPVVLLSVKEDGARGSARSIPGIDLYAAISACAEYLDRFGGHPMAAGLSLKSENLAAFRSAFESAIVEMAGSEELAPVLDIDAVLNLEMISERLINELETLEPFGPENEEPLFCATDVTVARAIPVGQGHQKLILKQPNGRSNQTVEAIWFNMPEDCQSARHFSELVFKLRWNYWNGEKRMQLMIEDGASP